MKKYLIISCCTLFLLGNISCLIAQNNWNPKVYDVLSAGELKEVLSDEFSSLSPDWVWANNSNVSTSVNSGKLIIKSGMLSYGNTTMLQYFPLDMQRDFQIEARYKSNSWLSSCDVRWGADKTSQDALCFGFVNSLQEYGIGSNQKDFAIDDIKAFETSSTIQKNNFNTLTIRKVKDRYYFFVNAVFVHECLVADHPVFGNYFGLSINSGCTVVADYFNIHYIEKKIIAQNIPKLTGRWELSEVYEIDAQTGAQKLADMRKWQDKQMVFTEKSFYLEGMDDDRNSGSYAVDVKGGVTLKFYPDEKDVFVGELQNGKLSVEFASRVNFILIEDGKNWNKDSLKNVDKILKTNAIVKATRMKYYQDSIRTADSIAKVKELQKRKTLVAGKWNIYDITSDAFATEEVRQKSIQELKYVNLVLKERNYAFDSLGIKYDWGTYYFDSETTMKFYSLRTQKELQVIFNGNDIIFTNNNSFTFYMQQTQGKLRQKLQMDSIERAKIIAKARQDSISSAMHADSLAKGLIVIGMTPKNVDNEFRTLVSSDQEGPNISIISPSLNRDLKVGVPAKNITITGIVKDESGIFELFVNEKEADVKPDGTFSIAIPLAVGDNAFTIKATDTKQNISEQKFTITRENVQPTPIIKASAGRYFALIIGVQDYKDEGIPDLDKPVIDAEKVYSTLKKYYTFDSVNMIFLKNPTKSEVTRALNSFRSKVSANDNLLVFYAGHGQWEDELEEGYWLLSDAARDNPGSWLSNNDLKTFIRGIKNKHTLLIADACFSGSLVRALPNEMSTYVKELDKLKSRKAMTSGAKKPVPDKSVFIEYLIQRLSENEEPYLSSEQLFNLFKIAVVNNSANGQVPQFAPLTETGDEGGDFIFIKK